MTDRYFRDEELVAYLDGETDFAPIEEIARALKNDVALAKRLEALRLDTDQIKTSFSGFTDLDLVPPKLPEPVVTNPRWGALVAGLVVAAGIGFGAGSLNPSTASADWKSYVAAYQALYINSTLSHVDTSKADQQNELNRVTAAIGKSINVKDLSMTPEVDYKRAQILGYQGKALIQLAFLSSTGDPIALCIIRSNDNKTSTVKTAVMEGMSAAHWSQNGYDYILIGGADQTLVSRLASSFQKNSL